MAGDPSEDSAFVEGMSQFQSAPAIDGGRSDSPINWRLDMDGFNPRPPSMAGDPTKVTTSADCTWCFNPRPPSMAGDPLAVATCPKAITFQSAPAIDGGRSDHGRQLIGQCVLVSIRARHRWRAILQ